MPSRLALLFALLAWFAFAGAHARGPQQAGHVDLRAHARYLLDPQQQLRLDDVRALPASAFVAHDAPPRAYRDGATWVRIEVPRTVPGGSWWLQAGPAHVDSIRLYGHAAGHSAEGLDLGAGVPFAARPVPFRTPVFPVELSAPSDDAARVLYLRVVSQTAAPVEPVLWRAEAFAAAAGRDHAAWGGYFGMIGLLILLNLYFWFDLRRGLYLHCALYLSLLFALPWLLEGFGAQWLLPHAPEGAVYLTRAVAFLTMGYTLWFGVELLEISRRFPRVHALACALSVLIASGALLILFVEDGPVIDAMLWLRMLWQPVFAALLVLQWRERPDLRWVGAAFVLQMLGSSLALSRHLGLVESPGWLWHDLYVIGLVHAVMLSVALMSRLRDSERRALEMSMRAEARLDRKVSERTAELASTNRRLETEIAERRAAQAELDAALRSERETLAAQRDFVAMVSHEFRTPLSIIKAVAQRLRAHASLADADLQQRLARLDRATGRMTAMIETYLADDRMRQPEVARAALPFPLQALIAAATEVHAAMDERLQVAPHEPLPDVCGDLPLLTIALSNLLDNALKYSDAPVRLRATADGDHARIDVIDRGIGVPDGERERIFQRYVRGSDGSGRPGAGLGLHLAREIARRHGGDLLLAESGPQGSTFSLLLPLAMADRANEAAASGPAREAPEDAHA